MRMAATSQKTTKVFVGWRYHPGISSNLGRPTSVALLFLEALFLAFGTTLTPTFSDKPVSRNSTTRVEMPARTPRSRSPPESGSRSTTATSSFDDRTAEIFDERSLRDEPTLISTGNDVETANPVGARNTINRRTKIRIGQQNVLHPKTLARRILFQTRNRIFSPSLFKV